jgi:hypothetical protein
MGTLVRQAEAAAYIKHAAGTLEKWRVSGRGPRYSKLGKIVVYDLDELDRFVEERTQRSTAENPRPDGRSPPHRKPRKTPPASAGTAA